MKSSEMLYPQCLLNEIQEEVLNYFKVDNCDVEFVPNSHLKKYVPKNSEYGLESAVGGVYTAYNSKIKLNGDQEILSLVVTFMHELVHHIQYSTGRMRNEIDEFGILRYFVFDDIHYDTDYPYEACPWEVEANTKQTKMYADFVFNCSNRKLIHKILDIHLLQQKVLKDVNN